MKLAKDKVGIAVNCTVCARRKKPHGRDSRDNGLCDGDCEGYRQEPQAGSLWPSESEFDYGFEVGDVGTTILPKKEGKG